MTNTEIYVNMADGASVLQDPHLQLQGLSIENVQLIIPGQDPQCDGDVLVGGDHDKLTDITAEIADFCFGSSATLPVGGVRKSIIVTGHWLPGETGCSAWHPPLDIFQISVAQQACQRCSDTGTFNNLGVRRISFQVQNLDLLSIKSACRFHCGAAEPGQERTVWSANNNDGVEGKVTKIFKILEEKQMRGSDGSNDKLRLELFCTQLK